MKANERPKKQLEPLPEPPAHLSEASRRLWANVVPRRVHHPESMALLQTALEARDRAEACREAIAAEGMVLGGGAMRHANPLLKTEKDSAALFARCWQALNLEWGQNTASPYGPNTGEGIA